MNAYIAHSGAWALAAIMIVGETGMMISTLLGYVLVFIGIGLFAQGYRCRPAWIGRWR